MNSSWNLLILSNMETTFSSDGKMVNLRQRKNKDFQTYILIYNNFALPKSN